MTSRQTRPAKKQPRRQYLVNRKLQLRIASQAASLVGIVGLACGGALFLAPRAISLQRISSDQAQLILTISIAAFFLASVGVVAGLSVLLTHRLAGPTRVIVSAIRKMRDGEFDGRLDIRDNDFLHPIAEEARALRDGLAADAHRRAERERMLHTLVERGDLGGLRDLLDAETDAKPLETAESPVTPV